jgi:hypothetical protein
MKGVQAVEARSVRGCDPDDAFGVGVSFDGESAEGMVVTVYCGRFAVTVDNMQVSLEGGVGEVEVHIVQ